MSPSPNRHLIGQPVAVADFATPALLVDLPVLKANVVTMAKLAARHGRALRPHAKAHKSRLIGRMQLDAGAVGICCATVREAEVMAGAGLDGILVTAPVVTPAMVARLIAAREHVARLAVVVDGEAEIDLLAERARLAKPIDVLVDVDMGQGRTGVSKAVDAVRLAAKIAATPVLRYCGVQAYYGHLQHVPALEDRRDRVAEQWRHLEGILDALGRAGLAAEIISGGGTGTHHLDLASAPFTELQPGSYLFMDAQYAAVEVAPGGSPFHRSLSVATRVVSTTQPDRVIVDAGSKALSTDAGPALIASGAPAAAVYRFMGDEHGAVVVTEGSIRPNLGDLVTLVVPHCDPTVNLYDHFHVVEDGRLVDIWPVEARGH
ncbi:MAG: DSD1 family PLP-dependent enzyme [Devosia sp.]|uniref:DSD1 family PLP-dependent enzyme n=1 Tax=Devosia sp. TaxID=1871048 RepID=UPI001A3CB45A|nr:DSD1 family PLP-dependent enzyme [Devosia sp.]MBL8598958.1 DSD1 family PLP-dependent enzyme [Devosia sp.]